MLHYGMSSKLRENGNFDLKKNISLFCRNTQGIA